MKPKPDATESRLGLLLFAAGVGLGMALSYLQYPVVIYAAFGAIAAPALFLPVKFRPWPLFVSFIPSVLFGMLVILITLFAGGGSIYLAPLNMVPPMLITAGTLITFDAAW